MGRLNAHHRLTRGLHCLGSYLHAPLPEFPSLANSLRTRALDRSDVFIKLHLAEASLFSSNARLLSWLTEHATKDVGEGHVLAFDHYMGDGAELITSGLRRAGRPRTL